MNQFDEDDRWQREQRDAILKPQFYERFTQSFIFLDPPPGKDSGAMRLQGCGIDTVAIDKQGRVFTVEEKIARWPATGVAHDAFAIETRSCTRPNHNSPGWIKTSIADHLLYCFQTEDGGLDCYMMSMPALRKWFMDRQERYPTFGPMQTLNASVGRIVKIADVVKALEVGRYRFHPARGDA